MYVSDKGVVTTLRVIYVKHQVDPLWRRDAKQYLHWLELFYNCLYHI